MCQMYTYQCAFTPATRACIVVQGAMRACEPYVHFIFIEASVSNSVHEHDNSSTPDSSTVPCHGCANG
jgi:hypothetical protein